MKYVEVSIEEAMKRCKKNAKVLVAQQDLENDDCEVIYSWNNYSIQCYM